MYSRDLVERAIEDYAESNAPTLWRRSPCTKLVVILRICY